MFTSTENGRPSPTTVLKSQCFYTDSEYEDMKVAEIQRIIDVKIELLKRMKDRRSPADRRSLFQF